MKKKITLISAIFLSFAFCFQATPVYADSIEDKGTRLLNELLTRQFDSYMTGELIDTSDLFIESESTALYNEYLYWYSGKTDATQKYWTDYEYDLTLEEINGNELTYSANLMYERVCSVNASEQHDFSYTISVSTINGFAYINEINTTEINFDDFKRLYSTSIIAATYSEHEHSVTDALIANSVAFNELCKTIAVNKAEVVNMDEIHQNYLTDNTKIVSTLATSYSYDGERGRKYADTYYETANSCFGQLNYDCTNFVSQCIWAAYGGWTNGDSEATMKANIEAKKRMQDGSSLSHWFGIKNGGGNPWVGVDELWDFVTDDQSTGPQATGHNNNKKATNLHPSSILTGQVLQLRTGSSGDYEHSIYVSGGVNDSFANITITQHSQNAKRQLDESIEGFGGSQCYMRQLKFTSANFDS